MKKLIIILLLSPGLSFAFLGLRCSMTEQTLYAEDSHVLVMGQALLSCKDRKNKSYSLSFRGFGPGFRADLTEKILLFCPSVNKKKLKETGEVYLYGLKADAALLLGASMSVVLNHKGGFCFFAGAKWISMGASLSLGELAIFVGPIGRYRDKMIY